MTEAKDTVMSEEALLKSEDALLEQAEISFKAGMVQGKMDYLLGQSELIIEAKLAGIREVVEWLRNDSYDTTIHFGEDWQAKLKEWGLA